MAESTSHFVKTAATRGLLRVGPLSRSTAESLGALLRRALLRQVRGAAVGAVRFADAGHEFALFAGVAEDGVQILENLRRLRLRLQGWTPLRLKLSARGPRVLKAADLADPRLRPADPEAPIATLGEGGRLDLEVEILSGQGWEAAGEGRPERPGWIAVHRRYGPVERVALHVREEGDALFLELDIETDGTLDPEEACARAAAALAAEAPAEDPLPALCLAIAEAARRPQHQESAPAAPEAFHTRTLGRAEAALEVPPLTLLPRASYEAFVQRSCPPAHRQDQGLEKLLRAAFAADARLEYEGYDLADADLSVGDCLRLGRTCAGGLTLRLRARGGERLQVGAGALPLMTEAGTFIVGGMEKVVVGQLRAPGEGGSCDLAQRRFLGVGAQLEEVLAAPLASDVEGLRQAPSTADLALPSFAAAIDDFFARGASLRQVEAANPLARLAQVRGLVQSGVGRGDLDARDAHASHFGRICLLETPEGEKIGLNLSAALFARTDGQGRLLTPYRRRADGRVEDLAPEDEGGKILADTDTGASYRARYNGRALARARGEIARVEPQEAQYEPVHPAQALGVSACLIPFLGHDDANRALMATNMQKQAVPLLAPQAPLVRTGLEERVARDAGSCVRALAAGTVVAVAADGIRVRESAGGRERAYPLTGFAGSPLGTCWRQRPLVRAGDAVAEGQLLAEGPSTEGGALALGRNLLVGYLSWEGYTYEDSFVVSERLVREGVFASVKVREFAAEIGEGKAGEWGAAHLPAEERAHLAPEGFAREGAFVEGGDVLIGRSVSSGGKRRDRSVRLPAGQRGRVIEVEHLSAAHGAPLAPGVAGRVRLVVAVRRDLRVGDKLANRHGAKGVVGRIAAEDEMPLLPDGRPLDLIIGPLCVPSRMNIGQLLETHLGLAAHALRCTVVTPGFGGATPEDVQALLEEAGLPPGGMLRLRDGRSGRLFDQPSTVGYQYVMKLDHMVDDSRRAYGPGASDGPRPGIMETWALQAHGAGHLLQEMLAGAAGRSAAAGALLQGLPLPEPALPGSLGRLAAQLRGLCLDLQVWRADGAPVDLLAGDIPAGQAASAALAFAGAQRVRAGSAGALSSDDPGSPFSLWYGEDDGRSIRHLDLAAPVLHPWRALLGEGAAALPPIEALPVLPPSLRNGRRLDPLYAAVRAADAAVRRGAADAGALQGAVDALLGEEGLTRLLYGKRGFFAAALAGRPVDFAARSVIAPGCDLEQDECGLPRSLAKTIFAPLVEGELLRSGRAPNAERAAHMLRAGDPAALKALEEVARERWVLLHRAPVLHRWGLQAFRPRLTDEEVLRLHPLSLAGFNADFDGDQMQVYLPLSAAAQQEARAMRPSANLVGSAAGVYMNSLVQDMVLGWYYATAKEPKGRAAGKFATPDAVAECFARGELEVHAAISVDGRRTTVGRTLFNRLLPETFRWVEEPVDRDLLPALALRCWREQGAQAAARLGDALMRAGFRLATLSGLSIGLGALKLYSQYERRLERAWQKAERLEARGREADLVAHWQRTTGEFADSALAELAADGQGLNPVHLMRVSGARSNREQIKQLVAMRGLMATPERRIIATPCTTSFVRGLSPLEYLMSTFGARKGLVDTVLRTSSAGFLYKRLVNAVQDLRIVAEDCGADEGLRKEALSADGLRIPLAERLAGRTALEDITLPGERQPLVGRGALIDAQEAGRLADLQQVAVRSPLSCRARGGLCARCYGADPGRGQRAAVGLPVGIIAAQSLGEPLTQLSLRTFAFGVSPQQGAHMGLVAGGLRRLDELFEAGQRPGRQPSEERARLEELLRRQGRLATAEHLLAALLQVYRSQGVHMDERHFEVVLRQMLGSARIADPGDSGLQTGALVPLAQLAASTKRPASAEPALLGISQAAALAPDFLAAALAHGGVPALARAALQGRRISLDGIRACTLFGKVPPPVQG